MYLRNSLSVRTLATRLCCVLWDYSGLPRRSIAAGARHERRFASIIQSDAVGVAKRVFVAQL